MNPIKKSIDETLESMEVSDELKERTWKHIHERSQRQKDQYHLGYVMKGLTLVASFTLIMVLSLSYVFQGDNPESEALKNYKIQFPPNRVKTDVFTTESQGQFEKADSKEDYKVDEEQEDSDHLRERE